MLELSLYCKGGEWKGEVFLWNNNNNKFNKVSIAISSYESTNRSDFTRGILSVLKMDETLADQIFAKINANLGLVQPESTIDDNVREVYTKYSQIFIIFFIYLTNRVGLMLSRYRSGKIPKAFKIVPRLKNWKEILYITQPDSWTPNSTYQATKIFISGMNPHLAEEYGYSLASFSFL